MSISSNENTVSFDPISAKDQPERPDVHSEFNRLLSELDPTTVDPAYGWDIDADSELAGQLLELIRQAPLLNPIDQAATPFHDYAKNTNEEWKYVPEQTVRDFLDSQRFVDTHLMGWQTEAERQRPTVNILSEKSQPIAIPLGLIVNVAGFDSWQGREPGGTTEKMPSSKFVMPKIASHDTIKHYAALDSELPSVEQVRVFVQPNGTVFADNGSGDSHRVAAAMLRGNQNIQADMVAIKLLDKNYVST